MKLLVTGGAGFIGSNFIRHVLETTDWTLTNYDLLTYAGNLENLADVPSAHGERYRFVRGDVADRADLDALLRDAGETFDAVVHVAAESHVDRSILDAGAFIRTNVLGTQTILEAARQHGIPRVVQVSTDEVYGTLSPTDPPFTELTPIAPNSPYAASKAAADLLCRAAFHTHKQDVVITRCSNNYGPYQFPEKLIPLMIAKALADEPLPVYGDGMQVRDWLHVRDHCRALVAVLVSGKAGEVYNIGGRAEKPNIEIVRRILAHLQKPETLIRHVTDRPGHDRRYAIEPAKIERECDFRPAYDFATGLAETIDWYVANETWWRRVMTGDYQKFLTANYAPKF